MAGIERVMPKRAHAAGDGGDTGVAHGANDNGRPHLGDQVIEGLGLEGMAAALVSEMSSEQIKQSREQARQAKDAQLRALDEQKTMLYKKAEALDDEAFANFNLALVSTVASAAGGQAVGTFVDKCGKELTKKEWGNEAIRREADATAAGARAKEAEADRDEHNTNIKQVQGVMDKAMQALESFVAERSAARRAILRST